MKAIISCLEQLRAKLDRHRNESLKEYSTRVIFIDPMLEALGWDVRDPEEVMLEYPTIDGKSVDYAMKVNRKPVLLIEAKSLDDPLTDMKAITQVVGYAANDGIEWCVLTNGINYKVYRSTEKATAPEKLLYEVSLDPKATEGISLNQIAEQLARFSRDAMAIGLLDEIGEEVFTIGKARKALDKLLLNPPPNFLKIVRSAIGDDSLKPNQIKTALKRLWGLSSKPPSAQREGVVEHKISITKPQKAVGYDEEHHTKGKPQEVIELFRAIDKFCTGLNLGVIQKRHIKHCVNYSHGKNIFCSVHLTQSGLRVWLKLKFSRLISPPDYVRDVSSIGHWGAGDVEVAINSVQRVEGALPLIHQSYEESKLSD